ncbi:MAG: MOP flippase family protein [Thermoplasmatota archaeon]
MKLRAKAQQSLRWNLTGSIGKQVVNLAMMVVLARLLTPHEFGLVAMILVFQSFAVLFGELGFGAAIIQRKELEDRHLSSVFWLNVGIGALLALIFFVGAPALAWFYDEPSLTALTRLTCLSFLLSGFTIVPRSLLQRDLAFRGLVAAELVANVAATALSITLAWLGYGAWALASWGVTLAATLLVLMWPLSRWRPRFSFDTGAVRDLLGFSSNVFGVRVLAYWSHNLDNLVIGKLLGTTTLGLYTRAYGILIIPVQNFGRSLGRVLFPVYSKLQDRPEALRRNHIRVLKAVAVAAFPCMVGLAMVAEPFIAVLYGDQWVSMAPLLRLLCAVGLIAIFRNLFGNLFLSQGRPDLQFRMVLVLRVVTFAGILIGVNWGAMGVAWGILAAQLLNSYPAMRIAGGLIGLRFTDFVKAVAPAAGLSATLAIWVWNVDAVLPHTWNVYVELAALAGAGAAWWAGWVSLLKVPGTRDLLQLALPRLQRGARRRRKATP